MLVSFLHFCLFLYYLSVFDCGGSSWLHLGFVWLQQAGLLSSCDAQTYCSVLSCCGVWAYCGVLSCCGARALGCTGFSRCGSCSQQLQLKCSLVHSLSFPMACGIYLDQGSNPLADGFLTSELPGKFQHRRTLKYVS